jgi:hypothetical protein
MAEERPQHSVVERLEELYRRLALLPRASTAEAALAELCCTLDEVEDEMSGVAKQWPPPFGPPGGRMYCPLDDHTLRRPDGSILALARAHRIEIEADGRLRIVNKVTSRVEFEK